VRGVQQLSNQGLSEYKASMKELQVFVLRFFTFLSAISPGFCLVLDHRGRVGGLGGKVRSACQEFEDNDDGILG